MPQDDRKGGNSEGALATEESPPFHKFFIL